MKITIDVTPEEIKKILTVLGSDREQNNVNLINRIVAGSKR